MYWKVVLIEQSSKRSFRVQWCFDEAFVHGRRFHVESVLIDRGAKSRSLPEKSFSSRSSTSITHRQSSSLAVRHSGRRGSEVRTSVFG